MATYKLIKGGGELVVAAIIAGMITFDAPAVQGLLQVLRQHVYRPWSATIAEAITRNITPHRVALAAVALLFDGALTTTEGWAIHRGRDWGRWLVVISTSTLLPVDIYVSLPRPTFAEASGVLFNVLVVLYLVRRARSSTLHRRS